MREISINTFLVLIGIIISLIFFLIANLFQDPAFCILYLVVFFTVMVLFCLKDFSQKLGLAFFYLCFFTFLLSGAVIPFLQRDEKWKMGFTDKDFIVACNCLIISCLFMMMGYGLADKCHSKVKALDVLNLMKDSKYSIIRLQRVSFYIFIVTTLGAFLFEYRKLLYAMKNGYVSLYTTFSESAWGTRLSLASMSSFFLVLSTRTNKKKTILIFALGIIHPLMELAEGARGGIVSYCLFVAFYLYKFNEFNLKGVLSKRKKRRKFIKFAGLMIAIAVITLPWLHDYGYSRSELSYVKASNLFDSILDFFVGQGRSFQMVGYASQFKGQLHSACYSFGGLWESVTGRTYPSQTAERALFGCSFGDAVTYRLYPSMYLNGYGMGSSYVAEIYYDFGYVGVSIINLFIGILLRKMTQWEKRNVIQIAIMLSVFYYMLIVPRGSLVRPIGCVFSKTNIAVWGVTYYLSRKKAGLIFKSNINGERMAC